MSKILIVDDERSIRNSLGELLEMEGHTVFKAENGPAALTTLEGGEFELVISDIKMPEMDGVELLEAITEKYPDLPVVMISGHGSIETAVSCLRKGAADFIEKPIDMNRVLASVRNALERGELKVENKSLRRKIHAVKGVDIIGQSTSITDLLRVISRVATTDARVLITGSNGTGKELAARQLHLQSGRADAPFVEVNCASIPSELIESELFGHEKGSFTNAFKQRKGKFEQAHHGTIFLDEIGDMSLAAQAKVLRALQENKISRVGSDADITVDVRVIAATNKNLVDEIAAGRFREDLYHRLSVIKVHIPALAERREDIPMLIAHFLKQICAEQSRLLMKIDPDAVSALQQMSWTGNIRELRNVIERLVILSAKPDRITLLDVTNNA